MECNKEIVMSRISKVCEQYNCVLRKSNKNAYYIDNAKFRIYLINYTQLQDGNYGYDISFDIVVKEDVINNGKVSKWVEKGRSHFVSNIRYLEGTIERRIQKLFELGYLGVSADNLKVDLDVEFDKIAKEVLGIDTLVTRKSDSLDFHEVSVWSLKQAFQKVFDLGVDTGYSIDKGKYPYA